MCVQAGYASVLKQRSGRLCDLKIDPKNYEQQPVERDKFFFLSRLACSLNYTYDGWQFKRQFFI